MDQDQQFSDARVDARMASGGSKRDPLLIGIIGTAIGLPLLIAGLAAFWGPGPILAQLPWYIPLISAFVALMTLSIAYLALGRYHVLRDALSFWVGSGFAAYGIGQILYALTWPGVLPGGNSILGELANTSAWVALVDLTLLNVFLLAAVFLRWPEKQSFRSARSWLWVLVTWLLIVVLGFGLLIAFEDKLPLFIGPEGQFGPPMRVWVDFLLLSFATGSILSVRHYQRSCDKLAGFIAFPQMALVFVSMMVLIGGRRYDLWWYVQRVVLVSGYLTVFFGLLSEYIRLLRRESESWQMLEAILENVPMGLAVTGGPPHFLLERMSRTGLEMNRHLIDRLISSASEAENSGWRIFLPDEVTQLAPEQMPLQRASHAGEEVRALELLLESPEGQQTSLLVSAAPIHDARGNIRSAISTWLDISERKRARQALQKNEALYRAIARNIPNGGIFVVDRDLRYVVAEGKVIEDLGYALDRFEGHTPSEIFDAETAARVEARFHRVFSGETLSHEMERLGRIYWTQYALLDDPPEHAIVITLDVTERKQAERALGESEQRFRAIINQATAGIIRSDKEGKLIFVNQAFCKMLGFSESELMGRHLSSMTHPDDVDEDKRLYERLLQKSLPFHLEKRFMRQDGSILWVNVSAAPILDAVDRPHAAVSVIVDISQRKQVEEALQQLNLQLERRVKERTLDLQNANDALLEHRKRLQVLSQRLVEVQEQERRALARELHDRVGQSLIALNLNLTIINNQLADKLTDPVSSRLADSIKLATEIIAIVRDVMSDLRPLVLDEYGLVAALRAFIAKFETRYDIHIEFSCSDQPLPPVGAAVEMTVLRIAQEALLNIVRHAQIGMASLSLQWPDHTLLLTVQDNGIGISSVQGSSYPDGHGLMIMRERAEAVGGTLRVISSPGMGTRVEANLPIQTEGKKETKDSVQE
jgi:PAS domain S-box-containing protein